MASRLFFVAMGCLVFCGGVGAQTLGGSLTSGLGWFWASQDLELPPSVADGRVEGLLGDPASPVGKYRVGAKLSGPLSVDWSEAWVTGYWGPVDLTWGRQTVAWGSTDVFNPVDSINPTDSSRPLAAEKIPVWAGRASLHGPVSVDLVIQPQFVASLLPVGVWRTTALPPGLETVIDQPRNSVENLLAGGRVQTSLDLFSGVDLALSYFRGRTLRASGAVKDQKLWLSYPRRETLGLELVGLGEGATVRAESAITVEEAGLGWKADRDHWSAQSVLAAEVPLPLFSSQVLTEAIWDWRGGVTAEKDSLSPSVALVISAEPDARWSLKLLGLYDLAGSALVSPEAAYTVADGVQVTTQAFGFWGESGTWAAFRDKNLVEGRVKVSF